MINAISRKHSLLTVRERRKWGFELLKESHRSSSVFVKIWLVLKENPPEENRYLLQQSFLIHRSQLCNSGNPCRGLLTREGHSEATTGYHGVQQVLQGHFCWSKKRGQDQIALENYASCQRTKGCAVYRKLKCIFG